MDNQWCSVWRRGQWEESEMTDRCGAMMTQEEEGRRRGRGEMEERGRGGEDGGREEVFTSNH